MKVAPSQTV